MAGMRRLIARDLPVLIIETVPGDLRSELLALGYRETRLADSPNRLFQADSLD